jgi:hypothetical protein
LKTECWDEEKNKDKNDNKQTPRNVLKGSNDKYWFKCDVCLHHFNITLKDVTRTDKRNSWCRFCKNKTETKLLNWLESDLKLPEDIKIQKIEPQYRPQWCSGKIYDFKITFKYKKKKIYIILELDGEQHFTQISNWNSPEDTQDNDIFKMNEAFKHNINVIRLYQPDIWHDRNNWEQDLTKRIQDIVENFDGEADVYYMGEYWEHFQTIDIYIE